MNPEKVPFKKRHSDADVVFGIRPIIESVKAGRPFDKVMLRRGLTGEMYQQLSEMLKEYGIPVQIVPEDALNRITRKNHQGAIGFTSPVEFFDIEQLVPHLYESNKVPFLLVLDRITDVRNFGALVRTAECAGVDAVIVPVKDTARISSDALKTSSGALSMVKICRSYGLIKTLTYLKNSGISLVAATEKAQHPYYSASFNLPVAIIAGSEDKGISPDLIELADISIHIPMLGQIESLNVSVATGIILFEVVRQRQQKM